MKNKDYEVQRDMLSVLEDMDACIRHNDEEEKLFNDLMYYFEQIFNEAH